MFTYSLNKNNNCDYNYIYKVLNEISKIIKNKDKIIIEIWKLFKIKLKIFLKKAKKL